MNLQRRQHLLVLSLTDIKHMHSRAVDGIWLDLNVCKDNSRAQIQTSNRHSIHALVTKSLSCIPCSLLRKRFAFTGWKKKKKVIPYLVIMWKEHSFFIIVSLPYRGQNDFKTSPKKQAYTVSLPCCYGPLANSCLFVPPTKRNVRVECFHPPDEWKSDIYSHFTSVWVSLIPREDCLAFKWLNVPLCFLAGC